jgi:hypothetical protein
MQEPCATVRQLPLPKLDCLFFRNVTLQLGPSADFPGVLHDCTGLTALGLISCTVQDPHAAATAIGAGPCGSCRTLLWKPAGMG